MRKMKHIAQLLIVATLAGGCAHAHPPGYIGQTNGVVKLRGYAGIDPWGAPLVYGETYVDSWVDEVRITRTGTNSIVRVTLVFCPDVQERLAALRKSDRWWEMAPKFTISTTGVLFHRVRKGETFPQQVSDTASVEDAVAIMAAFSNHQLKNKESSNQTGGR